MPEAKIKFQESEVTLNEGVTTLGRTTENDVSFPSDSNVSRFHAEIEARSGEYCIIDLNSSNGTTVNGVKVTGETYLKPGDRILLGGSSEVVFEGIGEPAAEEPESVEAHTSVSTPALPPVGDAVRQVPGLASTAAPAPEAGSRTMLMIAGGAVLVALVVVGVAGAIYYRSATSGCDATARIVKPEPGETIYEATEIEVNTENSECVARAVFTLDGQEFASSDIAPYTATLDPKDHPDLADGIDHRLGITLIDEEGTRVPQPGEIVLALETRRVAKPETKDPVSEQPVIPSGPKGKQLTIIEIQEMTNRLAKQFSGPQRYNVSNKQFLQEIQKKTAEYTQEGYYDKAAAYRDAINVAFVREQNLDPALGYILAMSRSRFDPTKQGNEEGLWKMNPDFVKTNAYDGLCGGSTIAQADQSCAARAAAVYMKAMVFGVFDGDPILSAVAFGRSTADATAWKATLAANRTDIWNAIRTTPERDQLVRLFAAGIVADNPQKFGLTRDKAISGLYP